MGACRLDLYTYVRRDSSWRGHSDSMAYVPIWAIKTGVGLVLVLVAIFFFMALLSNALRGTGTFADDIGKNFARLLPQPQPDIREEAQLKTLIRDMPDGKLRVATIVEEKDQVVFTVTVKRDAVRMYVKPGDELRLSKDGNVEVVPTGVPGLMDKLQYNLEELRKRIFGR